MADNAAFLRLQQPVSDVSITFITFFYYQYYIRSSSLRKRSLRCLVSVVCRCDGLFSLVNVACHAKIHNVHFN